jgi:hypothetical protein
MRRARLPMAPRGRAEPVRASPPAHDTEDGRDRFMMQVAGLRRARVDG